jgi:hypothetical protein
VFVIFAISMISGVLSNVSAEDENIPQLSMRLLPEPPARVPQIETNLVPEENTGPGIEYSGPVSSSAVSLPEPPSRQNRASAVSAIPVPPSVNDPVSTFPQVQKTSVLSLETETEKFVRKDFSGEDLMGVDFRSVNAAEANFSRSDLRSADLSGADLQYADFEGAYLKSARLCNANLEGANLKGAYLIGTDLTGARGLTLDMLRTAYTLHKVKLDPELIAKVQQFFPSKLVVRNCNWSYSPGDEKR